MGDDVTTCTIHHQDHPFQPFAFTLYLGQNDLYINTKNIYVLYLLYVFSVFTFNTLRIPKIKK